jgi:hypothetical protein
LLFVVQVSIYCPPTAANAVWFRRFIISIWVLLSGAFYFAAFSNGLAMSLFGKVIQHFVWFYLVDWPCLMAVLSATCLIKIFGSDSQNRLLGKQESQFHGRRIAVLGNGPSLVKGKPCGKYIDDMDEVVRFNNFQTKTSGLEQWTGSKTTMHFSDSMLYPSFPEYEVPGATVGLSLFMDRLMVAGSYLLFRTGVDLAFRECFDMMLNPELVTYLMRTSATLRRPWVSHIGSTPPVDV